MAGDPKNIRFIEGTEAHLAEHGGDWQNPTAGPLIDGLAKLGGPALLVFFTVFDEKLTQYTSSSECPMCSDPSSWRAMINPWNSLVEGSALLEALVAADQEQRQLDEELKKQQEKIKNCGMHGEACPAKK